MGIYIKSWNLGRVPNQALLLGGKPTVVYVHPGDEFELFDSVTGKVPADLVLHRTGGNLVVTSDSEDLRVQLRDFFNASLAQPSSITLGVAGVPNSTMILSVGTPLESLSDGQAGSLGVDQSLRVMALNPLGAGHPNGLGVASSGEASAWSQWVSSLSSGFSTAGPGVGVAAAATGTALALGGGGGATAAAAGVATATVAGTVTAGVFISTVQIELRDAQNNLLGTAQTQNGAFSIDVGAYRGTVLATVKDINGDAVDYIDEATGVATDLKTDLRAVGVVLADGKVSLHITPLSELVVRKLEQVTGGLTDSNQVNSANKAMADVFGLMGMDITKLEPQAVLNAQGQASFNVDNVSDAAKKFGVVLAALSGIDANVGGMADALNALANGLTIADGAATLSSNLLSDLVDGANKADIKISGSLSGAFTKLNSRFSASTISKVAADDTINANEQASGVVVSGTTEADAAVSLSFAAITRAATVSGTSWSYTLTAADITAMGQGNETLSLTITKDQQTSSLTRVINVDTVAPTAPTIGTVAGDNIINASEQTSVIRGTTEAGSTVNLNFSAAAHAATVSGTSWSYTLTAADITAMGQGSETLSVTTTDAAGNVSGVQTKNISVDTVAPTGSTISTVGGDNVINASEQSSGVIVSGTTEGGSTVNLNFAATEHAAAVSGTNWIYTLTAADITAMGQGSETLSVTATDAAGNVSSAQTKSINVDTMALTPTFGTVSGDDKISASEQVSGVVVSGTTEAGSSISLSFAAAAHAATVSGTSWSYTLTAADVTAMGQGSETLSVTATDAAGNVSDVQTKNISVDTVAPTAPTIGTVGGDNVINASEQSSGVVVSGTTEAGSSVSLSFAATAHAATVNGTSWSYTLTAADITAMGQGSEILSVTTTDVAGNVSGTQTKNITIDTSSPTVSAIAFASNSGADHSYTPTEVVSVSLTYTEMVTVTGTPTMTFNVGGIERTATYNSGSGTANLTFSYATVNGDFDFDGVSVTAGQVGLTGSSIRDAAGNDVSLSYSALSADSTGHVNGYLLAPLTTSTGRTYYIWDNDGSMSNSPVSGLTIKTHDEIESLFDMTNDQSFVLLDGKVYKLPTASELAALHSDATLNFSSLGWTSGLYYFTSTSAGTNTHEKVYLQDGFRLTGNYASDTDNTTAYMALLALERIDGSDTNAPVFSAGNNVSVNVIENTAASAVIHTATATDTTTVSYTLLGVDAGYFNLNTSNGQLKFLGKPDHEEPLDNGANNVYDVTVVAHDAAGHSNAQSIHVTVTDVLESSAPSHSITLPGLTGQLIAPSTATNGNTYYFWDRNGNGVADTGDVTSHDQIETELGWTNAGGSKTMNGLTLSLPTKDELLDIQSNQTLNVASAWLTDSNNSFFMSSSQMGNANAHNEVSLQDGTVVSEVYSGSPGLSTNDTLSTYAVLHVVF